jgi:apolipoprotein D and lipocalin family protein
MKKSFFTLLVILLTFQASASELETVPYVDAQRYLGDWYEIARYDNWFQRKCGAVRVTYTAREDGKINVFNTCKDPETNEITSASGRARIIDPETNAKLKVTFIPLYLPIFEGDYWIIDLDEENYQWAVVGNPARDYLWVLSRTPKMSPELLDSLMSNIEIQGFDLDKLNKTPSWK